jgi:hypothetical protein
MKLVELRSLTLLNGTLEAGKNARGTPMAANRGSSSTSSLTGVGAAAPTAAPKCDGAAPAAAAAAAQPASALSSRSNSDDAITAHGGGVPAQGAPGTAA